MSEQPARPPEPSARQDELPAAQAEHEPRDNPRPTKPKERIVTLDLLRGVAILGILIVNIEFFRGSDFYLLLANVLPEASGADRVAQFFSGWLGLGKFMTCFALLFGMGAAMMTQRAYRAGASPHRLLARRYGWLAVFGIAHMLLLFHGDILFLYALCGFLLLLFINLRPRTLFIVGGALLGVIAFVGFSFAVLGVVLSGLFEGALEQEIQEPSESVAEIRAVDDSELAEGGDARGGDETAQRGDREDAESAPPDTSFQTIISSEEGWETFVLAQQRRLHEIYIGGTFREQLVARAFESMFFQAFSLLGLPWVLGLFIMGLAIGRTGVLGRLHEKRRMLLGIAAACLPIGLLLNLPLGYLGPLAASGFELDAGHTPFLTITAALGSTFGTPILALGYLSGIALLCQREGFRRLAFPLERTGRMALTAYILQSLLCWFFFVGLGFYDRLSSAPAMLVVLGVWAVLLIFCTLWMSRFQMGPLERLWRRLTYGRPAAQ